MPLVDSIVKDGVCTILKYQHYGTYLCTKHVVNYQNKYNICHRKPLAIHHKVNASYNIALNY